MPTKYRQTRETKDSIIIFVFVAYKLRIFDKTNPGEKKTVITWTLLNFNTFECPINNDNTYFIVATRVPSNLKILSIGIYRK